MFDVESYEELVDFDNHTMYFKIKERYYWILSIKKNRYRNRHFAMIDEHTYNKLIALVNEFKESDASELKKEIQKSIEDLVYNVGEYGI